MERKSRKTGGKYSRAPKKTVIFKVLAVVFCLGMIFSGYQVFSAAHEDQDAEDAYTQLTVTLQKEAFRKQEQTIEAEIADDIMELPVFDPANPQRKQTVDFAPLQQTSPEIAGWIQGEGIGIDYPIMQGKDNSFYLTHLYDGTENANGSIFLDYRNGGLFTDPNTVIYGHNMKNGTMFHPLHEYMAQDFYDEYPSLMIFTPEGDYRIDLICGTVEDGDNEIFRFEFDSDQQVVDYVERFRASSTFRSNVELEPGDKIVTLCTCTYELINARYALIGRVTALYN